MAEHRAAHPGRRGHLHGLQPEVFKNEDAAQIKTWLDVAKVYPNYKGKILWWHPVGDPAGLAQILSITMDRGADYKNNDEIKKSIQWIKDNVDPYVLRYVRGYGDFTVLVEKEEAYRGRDVVRHQQEVHPERPGQADLGQQLHVRCPATWP